MRKYSTISFLLAIAAFAFLTSSVKSYRINVAENFIKEMLEKMIYVEGAELFYGHNHIPKLQEKDSLLFANVIYDNRVKVPSFYMAATEVTTLDWWKFYNDKVHEIGKEEALLLFYPDSTRIVSEFPYSYNDPMTRNYYWHTRYDNYPVSSISWNQAKEYCIWKSNLFNETAADLGIDLKLEFRLPNEAEWELAAGRPVILRSKDRITDRRLYPWDGIGYIRDGKYLANFGTIDDQNGVRVKGYPADEALYYSETGSYHPNDLGIYDMAGNVSEWVDLVSGFSFEEEIKKLLDQCIKHAAEYKNYDIKPCEDNVRHNEAIVSGSNKGINKGGSWADGLAYLQIGSRQVMDKDAKSSRVGFRIAVSDPGDKYRKYFPKKNWTPK